MITGAQAIVNCLRREGIDHVEMPAGYRIGKIAIPPDLEEKTLHEINFRSKYRFQVLALVRTSEDGKSERFIADPQFRFRRGDSVVVIGTNEDFDRYQAELASHLEQQGRGL